MLRCIASQPTHQRPDASAGLVVPSGQNDAHGAADQRDDAEVDGPVRPTSHLGGRQRFQSHVDVDGDGVDDLNADRVVPMGPGLNVTQQSPRTGARAGGQSDRIRPGPGESVELLDCPAEGLSPEQRIGGWRRRAWRMGFHPLAIDLRCVPA